ncbi:mitochondrial fission ELM1 family protein [Thermomonas flagellata]|uniref:mitochondrial fission ELM1 family protein n=1 Tax=Thermomonas flagellata TaxID=2888524 RepID=UPI001F03B255|nr:mitochondrial fission ELM1 family protein [Thermomonas flagellata]
MPPAAPSLLAVHDGRAGNARQALALARALDPQAAEWALQPGWLARRLAPRRWPGLRAPFGAQFAALCRQPPALAIGCGRLAALATRLLGAGGARTVQILDPRLSPRHWDLLVVPAHDRVRGENVLTLRGSLHPVDAGWLAAARRAFPALAALPAPHTVLLVGGPTRHAALDDAGFQALLRQLAAHARAEGGSFSVVASRRTPPAWRAALAMLPADVPGLRWRDSGDGANPYAGLLAHADRLVCTADSVNMLSEAAATAAPLFVWQPDRTQGRLHAFLADLLASGRARPLDAALAAYPVTPLRETARIAAAVRARLGLP